MRSIFLQNALNQESNILGQVRELNALVLKYAIQQVLTQVNQYVAYNKHIHCEREVMPHSINTSIRGSRQLELKPWF